MCLTGHGLDNIYKQRPVERTGFCSNIYKLCALQVHEVSVILENNSFFKRNKRKHPLKQLLAFQKSPDEDQSFSLWGLNGGNRGTGKAEAKRRGDNLFYHLVNPQHGVFIFCTCIYIYTRTYIYTYIYRERERKLSCVEVFMGRVYLHSTIIFYEGCKATLRDVKGRKFAGYLNSFLQFFSLFLSRPKFQPS